MGARGTAGSWRRACISTDYARGEPSNSSGSCTGAKASMELVTVGTGTVAPSAERVCACHWVARGDLRVLLDCGSGALHRLAQFGLAWDRISHVVLSHFHADHYSDLPMLVYALK